jgi:hypothetical protein
MRKSFGWMPAVLGSCLMLFPAAAEAREQTWLASISGSYVYSAESSYPGDKSLGCTITDLREVTYETQFNSRLPVTITVSDEGTAEEGQISIGNGTLPIRGDQKRTTRDTYIHEGTNESCHGTYPQDPVRCNKTGKGTASLFPDTYPVYPTGEYETIVTDPDLDSLTVNGIYSGGTDCFGHLTVFADDHVSRFFLPAAAGVQNKATLLRPSRKVRREGLILKGSESRLEGGTAGPDHDGTWSSGWTAKWKLKLVHVD